MRKNCERFVAACLSASMLLGICMPGAVAATVEEEDPTDYVEVFPVTYEAPEVDEAPRLDVKADDEGNVDAEVVGRPETTPEEPDVEWDLDKKLEGEEADKLGKEEIKADAEGSETYTPSETVTDGADRVTEEGGETKGEETVKTEVAEKPEHETVTSPEIKSDVIPGSKPAESQPEDGKDDQTPGEPTEGGDGETTDQPEEGGQAETEKKPTAEADQIVDKDGKPVLDEDGNLKYETKKDTWNLTEDDLRDLVEKPTLPEGYPEDGNFTEISEDGSTTTTKNWVCEDYTHTETTSDGTTVKGYGYGYKVTETVTTTKTEKIDPDMSARPENAKDVTSEDGLIGYSYTEVTWTSEGARVETTYTVYPEQGAKTTITKTTTTKLTYAEQKSEGSVEITDVTVKEGDGHGSLTGTQGPQADPNKTPGYLDVDAETGLRDNYVESKTDLDKAEIGNNNFIIKLESKEDEEKVKTLIDVWGASIYEVKTSGNDKTGHPTLYIVRSPKKDGQGNIIEGQYDEYYVYCVDRGMGLDGKGYNLENLKDAEYFNSEEWDKIESIAVNGYWGVKNEDATGKDPTYGSLDAFKAMLQAQNPDYWKDDKLALLNDGMALAVTQAAIWKYGSSSGNTTVDDPFQSVSIKNPKYGTPTGKYDSDGKPILNEQWLITGNTLDSATKALMMEAYNTLLDKAAKTENKSTDLIDAEDITNVKVTINGKEKDKDVYDTDLSFTMAVQPDRMKSDDLMVTVTLSNGTYTYRLEGAAKEGEKTAEKTTGKNDITYVLRGIKMPDGTEVSINLSGTQSLGKSAYLLTAEGGYDKSQSFVGVFEGEREVNVNVNLKFNASQPTATITTDTTVETKVEQTKQTSWADSWLKKIFYLKPEQPEEPTTPEIPVEPETPTEPEITEKPDNTEEIVDAATPAPEIDSVPKTGDDGSVWMVLCMLSAAGLAVLNLPKKKAKH